jgi:hypothetical protein
MRHFLTVPDILGALQQAEMWASGYLQPAGKFFSTQNFSKLSKKQNNCSEYMSNTKF